MADSSSDYYSRPRLDGFPLIYDLSDSKADLHPGRPYFCYTEDRDPDTIINITHSEVKQASHRFACFLSKIPGYDPLAREPVAVLALSDTPVYTAIFLGTLRAGMIPFFMNPRNSVLAIVDLITKTSCSRILTTPTLDPLIKQVLQQLERNTSDLHIRVELVPDMQSLYSDSDQKDQHFSIPVKQPELDDTLFYLHSSGSTGFPEAIPQTRRALCSWCNRGYLDAWAKHPTLCIAVMPLPMFHVFAIVMNTVTAIIGGTSMAIYPPRVWKPEDLPYIPSPSSSIEHTMRAGCNAAAVLPSFLHEWAQDEVHLGVLKKMCLVIYGGGPLIPAVGDLCVENGVPLLNLYGSTETGVISDGEMVSRDVLRGWQYFKFDPRVTIKWIDRNDGTFETYFMASESHVPSVLNVDSARGYTSSDLFARHPSRSELCKVVGRADNVIVLSTAEKIVPEPLEGTIAAHHLIQGVVMFGQARPYVGILVEPKAGTLDYRDLKGVDSFKDMIWPVITQANDQAPDFGQIFKEMVLVTSPGKPLPRAAKGTVLSKAALKVYEKEIHGLYDDKGSRASGNVSKNTGSMPGPPSLTSVYGLEAWLSGEADDLLSKGALDPTKDLFHQGFNSLHATLLRNRIVEVLTARVFSNLSVPLDLVYKKPILRELAEAIPCLIIGDSSTSAIHDDYGSASTVRAIREMINTYSQTLLPLPPSNPSLSQNAPLELTVLLTGSTGNLGSHLLAYLIQHPNVRCVYAHNRASSGSSNPQLLVERQQKSFRAHGLDIALLGHEKLYLLKGDLTDPMLGLSQETHAEVLEAVNVVIHNAWKSNFNLTLQSFVPFIDGSVNLINFSLKSKHASQLRFSFTSSIASIGSWHNESGCVPELSISDARVALGGGYGESKYIVERVLQKAGLSSSTLRMTQLCGEQGTGCWSTEEWFPAMVRSGIALGLLPLAKGLVSWVSLPNAARIVLDDALSADFHGVNVLNLEHPQPIPWNVIVGYLNNALLDHCVTQAPLPLISLSDWLRKLENIAVGATHEELQAMPALKLLPFFQSLASQGPDQIMFGGQAQFSVDKLMARSKTMASMRPLSSEDVSQWVKYWARVGFLKTKDTAKEQLGEEHA